MPHKGAQQEGVYVEGVPGRDPSKNKDIAQGPVVLVDAARLDGQFRQPGPKKCGEEE